MLLPPRKLRPLAAQSVLACSVLAVSAQVATASPADITYAQVVKEPNRAKLNPELMAYLLGVGSVIKLDYICPEADRQALSDPSKMIDELATFAKTPWGDLYLTPSTFGPAGISISMSAGTAVLQIFTEHSRCIRHEQPRPQH